jgi:pyrimidine operon attenuation protein/uracil phosphoribosyltransferase
MGSTHSILMDAMDIDRSLHRIALQIMEINRGVDKLALVGIHTGGVFLADRLQTIIRQQEQRELPVGSLDITLYRDDWTQIAQLPIVKTTDIPFSVEGWTIILIDDVLYSGRTIRAALDAIMDIGRPRTIELGVLINRKCGRELPIQANYAGMDVMESRNEHVHVLLKEKHGCDEVILVSNS